jgi:hypothetical protein
MKVMKTMSILLPCLSGVNLINLEFPKVLALS